MARLAVEIDGRGAQRGGNVVVRSLNRIRAAAGQSDRALRKQNDSFRKARKESVGLGKAIGALAGALAVQRVFQYADAWTLVQNRLRLVTDSQEELIAVTEEVFDISQRTRNSLEGTAELYARIARSSDDLGLSQRRLLDVTESVSQAITISGVSAQAANAAIVQLGQGLASGALRGDELRSVLEQTPRLARAIADGLDVPIGKLRELGQEGELTAEKVIAALESQADVLEAEFGDIDVTIGQGFTTLTNSLTRFIGRLSDVTGLGTGAARTLQILSGEIDSVGEGFFDAAFEVSQFVRALAAGLTTIEPRFELFKNTVTGTLATIFGDEAVAEQAAQDRVALQRELDRQLTIVLDFLDEEREAFEERKAAYEAAGEVDLTITPDVDAALGAFDRELDRLKNEFQRLSAIAIELDVTVPELDLKTDSLDEVQDKLAALRKNLQGFGEAIAQSVRTPLEEYQSQLNTLSVALDAGVISQETYNRAVAQSREAYQESLPELVAYNEKLEEGRQLTEELLTPQEEYERELQRIGELLNVGAINQETYNRALVRAQDELKAAVDENDGFAKFLEQASIQAARNIQSAFADFLFDPFDDGLRGLVSNFADTLRRLAAEALSAEVFQILGNQLASLGGGGGLGGFLASALGGIFGGAFADGGDFSAGRPILVGENGPEIITPKTPGTVIPNEGMAAMAPPEVNVTVPITNVSDPQAAVAALESNQGQNAIVNAIVQNPDAVRRALS